MLQGVGSSESVQRGNLCCDGCIGDNLPSRLQFDKTLPKQTGYKRRVATHVVSEDMKSHLKANLVKERDTYMQSHPDYYMAGYSYVCPDCVIDYLCEQARFIKCEEDIDVIGVRPKLKSIFYGIIINMLASAPPAKRSRRTLC